MYLLIGKHLPTYDVRTRHEIEVQAYATATYRAVRNLDLGKSILEGGAELEQGSRP